MCCPEIWLRVSWRNPNRRLKPGENERVGCVCVRKLLKRFFSRRSLPQVESCKVLTITLDYLSRAAVRLGLRVVDDRGGRLVGQGELGDATVSKNGAGYLRQDELYQSHTPTFIEPICSHSIRGPAER